MHAKPISSAGSSALDGRRFGFRWQQLLLVIKALAAREEVV
jgi:hypothetical protein